MSGLEWFPLRQKDTVPSLSGSDLTRCETDEASSSLANHTFSQSCGATGRVLVPGSARQRNETGDTGRDPLETTSPAEKLVVY